MRLIKILIIILCFSLGLLVSSAYRFWQFKNIPQNTFTPDKSIFILTPPQEALTGRIISITNSVKKISRGQTDYKKAKINEFVREGENLLTESKSGTKIEFPNQVLLDIREKTEIDFSNLRQKTFLLKQTDGTVQYKPSNGKTMSVRTLHALIEIEGVVGVQTNLEKQQIIIEIVEGKVKIAQADLNDETHVWEIGAGKSVMIQDESRELVYL